jgi:hypothetical protein
VAVNIRHRFVLGSTFAAINAALVIWDVHNVRVIERMGMAWDTGAPIWPYQASAILFAAFNAPACVIAQPIIHYGRMFTPADYIVRYPVAVVWWYLVGLYFDSHPMQVRRSRWLWLSLCIIAAILFTLAGVFIAREGLGWLQEGFGWLHLDAHDTSLLLLVLLRDLAPAAWCFAFATALGRGALRLLRFSWR